MFTVMVLFDGSGNNNTVNPLASLYSVIPSTLVIFSGAGKVAFADFFCDTAGVSRRANARAKQICLSNECVVLSF